MRQIVFTALFVILFIFIVPVKSNAQTGGLDMARSDPVSITLSPTSPAPYSRFTLSLSGAVVDLSNSTFSVFVNDKKVATGSGNKSIQLTSTSAGTTMYISVVISSGGKTYTKNIRIHPLGLALVTEPISSAPPLYKGKSGIPDSGSVRIVAVPDFRTVNGTYLSPKKLSYTWRDISKQNAILDSGVGHDAIVVSAPLLYRTKTISVLVQDASATYVSTRNIDLTTNTPSVHVYISDPLMGVMYNHAITDAYSISSNDTTFIAVPYGFSTQKTSPIIKWLLNGTGTQTGSRITVHPQGSGTGVETLSVSVDTPQTYTNASSQFKILFGSLKPNSWLFGL